jgi:lipopolysaccharide transport system ATP-binding protein
MSSDLAVRVEGLSKVYRIGQGSRHTRVTEAAAAAIRGVFTRRRSESFSALYDVSFDVARGEVFGVVGRNGAGKSTLLKILSRITAPSEGEVRLYGKVGSLLEVGTGFHPELTGRENIFLNGTILGMRSRDIKRQFDAIVGFAEVERFLDTPVKRYSSGMYVRLAFAVAAHLNPEILIVDEVLAVGDSAFQQKCLGKMHEVSSEEGRTVLFVSHNLAAVKSLCTRGLLLAGGRQMECGDIDTVLSAYASREPTPLSAQVSSSVPGLRLTDVRVNGEATTVAEVDFLSPLRVEIDLDTEEVTPSCIPCFRWHDDSGVALSEVWGPEEGVDFATYRGSFDFTMELDSVALMPGRHFIDFFLHDTAGKELVAAPECVQIDVQGVSLPGAPRAYEGRHGLVRLANSLSASRVRTG